MQSTLLKHQRLHRCVTMISFGLPDQLYPQKTNKPDVFTAACLTASFERLRRLSVTDRLIGYAKHSDPLSGKLPASCHISVQSLVGR